MVVRAVIFDVGGVLERIEGMHVWLDPWRERLGMTDDAFSAALGAADPENGISTGHMSLNDWRDRCADELGLSSEQADAFVADMWDWYCGQLDEELMAYAANLRRRYRTAIISNSGSGAREVEESRYGFSTYFDPIIYSHEVGLLKPDPRIYARPVTGSASSHTRRSSLTTHRSASMEREPSGCTACFTSPPRRPSRPSTPCLRTERTCLRFDEQ
ncbi:hypothetical protein GCM10023317_88050 [Actinopolymorpha pittospori]